MSIKTTQAYEASDGSIHKTPDDWAIHEIAALLNQCSFNFDKEVAKEVLIRGDKLNDIIQTHKSHLDYYDKVVPSLLRPERSIAKDAGPKIDTTVIPPEEPHKTSPEKPGYFSKCSKALAEKGLAYPRTCSICGLGPCTELPSLEVTVTAEKPVDPEWRNKSRDHPSEAPLDQPVGVGTGMKLGGALDDVAF